MLPNTADEVLLAELDVIVTAGQDLPERPSREPQLRHLLAATENDQGGSYHQRAVRLLASLGRALTEAVDEPEALITEEQLTGLRILFGFESGYQETGADERRRNAAEWLVPSWRGTNPRTWGNSFKKRHQRVWLRIVLEAMKRLYGQRTQEFSPYHSLISEVREYWVNADRQLYLSRVTAVNRWLVDGLEHYGWYEQTNDFQPGVVSETRMIREHPMTPGISLKSDELSQSRPGARSIEFSLPTPSKAGEKFAYVFEERLEFNEEATRWFSQYVALEVQNDNFDLTLRVHFEGERPVQVWWFDVPSAFVLSAVGPEPGHEVDVHTTGVGTAERRWTRTDRRLNYGLGWHWTPDPTEDEATRDQPGVI